VLHYGAAVDFGKVSAKITCGFGGIFDEVENLTPPAIRESFEDHILIVNP